MSAYDIEGLEPVWSKMKDATRPNKPIDDVRGPLVYELTSEGSLNGIDPTCKDKPGGCVHEPRG